MATFLLKFRFVSLKPALLCIKLGLYTPRSSPSLDTILSFATTDLNVPLFPVGSGVAIFFLSINTSTRHCFCSLLFPGNNCLTRTCKYDGRLMYNPVIFYFIHTENKYTTTISQRGANSIYTFSIEMRVDHTYLWKKYFLQDLLSNSSYHINSKLSNNIKVKLILHSYVL